MSVTTFVHPTPDSTRDDLAATMAHLCDQAKELRRRGYAGTASQRYADLHANIDVLLSTYELAKR